jgi:16S rRNA (adenine1518-N6/adenine1519-N6)-dimethyltransferase
MAVKPKKHLGQHFLKEASVAKKIADTLSLKGYDKVLEIGPGMGVLTAYLLEKPVTTYAIEIDSESIAYLQAHFLELSDRIIKADVLKYDFSNTFGKDPFAIIGNFPYNISSQILFKCLEYRNQIPEIMGMFQKEVAERISQGPGKKAYGILSVFMQAYYDIEYLFTVDEHVFEPPPKVKSGVIRCIRNSREKLGCDEVFFKKVVKTAFNQRRKTLRNSLKSITNGVDLPERFSGERPEQLSVDDFVELTLFLKPE